MATTSNKGQILIEFLITILLMMSFLAVGYQMQVAAKEEATKNRFQPKTSTISPFFIKRKDP